ncbi:MAG: FtsX-like permease family protein [Gammaproteobacteria bacterium]|nr:MAG: FtsX-like permease family protein [Gammaproteobacteria bacterium]
MLDGLQEIYYSLRQNKLRTIITGFGVFWGIFMLILMLGSGQGMRNGAEQGFGNIATDTITFNGGVTKIAYAGTKIGSTVKITLADTQIIKNTYPEIAFMAIENTTGNVQTIYEKNSGAFQVVGVGEQYFAIKEKLLFLAGRTLNEIDHQETRKSAVIGKPVADRLFGGAENSLGKDIKLNNIYFKVIAVFDDDDNMGMAGNKIYIPLTTYKTVFRYDAYVDSLFVRPKAGVDGAALEEKILKLLKDRHRVSPDDNRGISSFNRAKNLEGLNKVFFGINALIWFVGIGTLMAGIVGVSNIMIITVKERTREIGIRKALGATPASIVSTLLIESILVTTIAGYLGMVLGVGLLELVSYGLEHSGAKMFFFKNPEIDFHVATTAIVILVSVGAAAGFVPAARAARISPIEAMRQD